MRSPTDSPFQIYPLSESSVTIQFGNEINERLSQQVSGFNNIIRQNPFPGFQTTVPAYATLTVFFNPLEVFQSALAGAGCLEKVRSYLTSLGGNIPQNITSVLNTITIPVCYGRDLGPDLEEVALMNKLTTDEVVSLHSSAIYKVYMIGFVPGFAYLGGMPEQISAPRKQTPRGAIPAGSVGIAGMQTGIYPLQTPGGWQIIGRTPLKMFNAQSKQPSLLKSGDKIVFQPISLEEFENLAARQ